MADNSLSETYQGGILSGAMPRPWTRERSGLSFLMGPEFFTGLTPYQSHQDTVAGVDLPPVLPSGIILLTVDQLRAIMPDVKLSGLEAAQMPLAIAMADHGISLPGQQAAFLGQIAAEGGLGGRSEDLFYKTPGLLADQYGRRRFPSPDVEQQYLRNPEKLANYVYGGRFGNIPDADDGWTYRGRGPMQVTGRDNYRAIGFENDPNALDTPYGGSRSAAAWWENNRLPARTATDLDREEHDRVTNIVNKVADNRSRDLRWKTYQRALGILGR